MGDVHSVSETLAFKEGDVVMPGSDVQKKEVDVMDPMDRLEEVLLGRSNGNMVELSGSKQVICGAELEPITSCKWKHIPKMDHAKLVKSNHEPSSSSKNSHSQAIDDSLIYRMEKRRHVGIVNGKHQTLPSD